MYKRVFTELTTNKRVDRQVLIATKVLDNGVDIIDDDLCAVVIDHVDKTTFLQMLGRKCVKEGERITLYIKQTNLKTIRALRKMAAEEIDYALLQRTSIFCVDRFPQSAAL